MKARLYYIFVFTFLTVLVMACKKTNKGDSVIIVNDPNFTPITTEYDVLIHQENAIPCFYENNFFNMSVDSLPFSKYSWYTIRDGNRLFISRNKSQVLTAEGNYELEYTYNRGVEIVDTVIKFSIEYCHVGISMSDAFSPNGDGQYDEWKPFAEGVARYSCVVRDNRMVVMFSSPDIEKGWDGTYNGASMPSGTYQYTLEGAFKNGSLFEYKGSIELLR